MEHTIAVCDDYQPKVDIQPITSHSPSIIDIVAPFVDTGFAIHWLHPRGKNPIGNGWQERPVATLEGLKSSYGPGYNVGVRLGEWSRVAGGYLHVLDMDIRLESEAPDAWDALREFFPTAEAICPIVQSGSGGESRHLYLITEKPFRTRKIATSGVKFIGADGSEHWTWEIDLFGTGKQVVMPPSIHPVTGLPYRWLREFDFDVLPLGLGPWIASEVVTAAGADEDTSDDELYDPAITDPPTDLSIDEVRFHLWNLGEKRWYYDHWFRIGMALHHQFQAGIDGLRLWEKISRERRKYEKGGTARKWRSFRKICRKRPVTFRTVIEWSREDSAADYGDQFEDLPELSEVVAPAEDWTELIGSPSSTDNDFDSTPPAPTINWTSLLDLNPEGAIKPTLHNVELIVKNDPRLKGLPQLNEFTQETVQRTPPGTRQRRKNAAKEVRQLSGRVWEVKDPLNGVLWSDDRDFAIRSILEAPKTQGGYGVKVTDRDLKAAVVLAANGNAFHPVREYLEKTAWDGVRRLDKLFVDYLGAEDSPYSYEVASLTMIAAVTRIFEPGHKFDHVPILEGAQGKRKSTFIRILGRHWFGELTEFSDTQKAVEVMQGKFVLEIPELAGFSRAEVNDAKAFVSRTHDRVRLAYARRAGEFPRQSVFFGSTNDAVYLLDNTGNRRWWPVKCNCETIDTAALEQVIDQVWAEAVVRYRGMRKKQPRGTLPLFLSPEAESEAAAHQEAARHESAEESYAGQIAAWLEKPINDGGFAVGDHQLPLRTSVCLREIWCDCLGREDRAYKDIDGRILGRAMRRVPGWKSAGTRNAGRWGRQKVFVRIDAPPDDDET